MMISTPRRTKAKVSGAKAPSNRTAARHNKSNASWTYSTSTVHLPADRKRRDSHRGCGGDSRGKYRALPASHGLVACLGLERASQRTLQTMNPATDGIKTNEENHDAHLKPGRVVRKDADVEQHQIRVRLDHRCRRYGQRNNLRRSSRFSWQHER